MAPLSESNKSEKPLENEGKLISVAHFPSQSEHESGMIDPLSEWLDRCPVPLSDDGRRAILAIVEREQSKG